MDLNPIRRLLAAVVLSVTVLAGSPVALAHLPVFFWRGGVPAERPYLIPDITERSRALYGQIGEGEVHRYRFVADAGDHVYLGLLVPSGQAGVPGAVVRTPGGGEVPLEPVREPVFEVFTQMHLVRVGRLEWTVPETGLYEALVFPAETLAASAGGSGPLKYVLSAGHDERFGPLDLFKGPLWWLEAHLWLWR